VGAGASGFDAAAVALENGAGQVSILMRRPHIPYINKAASIVYSGFSEGYYALSDQRRLSLMEECYRNGVPPPFEALDRVNQYSQFSVKKGVEIYVCKVVGESVSIETNQGIFECDFLILATGFALDGSCQPELRSFFSDVMLWKDKYNVSSWFGNSPYLGTHFQFFEKPGSSLPYLNHIYCFNYAATLSHGL